MAIPSGNKILKKHEVILAVGIILMAFGLILFFAGRWELKQEGFLGKPAPEIEFELEPGVSNSLSKQQGSVVLLNFWASWCAPCIEEMPSLKMLEDHFKSQGFVLLAFNIEGDAHETLDGKLEKSQLPGNLVFNFPKEQLKPYSVDAIPISILINKRGKIHRVYQGPRNWMKLEVLREIETLIKE
jgi:thiol-disulfide isomerase/thioredoxin